MKLKFVEDSVVQAATRGRKAVYDWSTFIEELYKYPNKWAEAPIKIAHSRTGYRIREMFKDIEVTMTGGNNLKVEDPKKKNWTLYVRYVPSVQEDETF